MNAARTVDGRKLRIVHVFRAPLGGLFRHVVDLAAEQVRDVCIVPVSFVSDHVETLGEIDHEAREEAAELGLGQFEMTAGLNDSPKFISALAQLVLQAAGKHKPVALPDPQSIASPWMAAD